MPETIWILLFPISAMILYSLSESGADILDENKPRASAGVGISWLSPFGPVKFYLSKAILKENYDKKEIFRFSFGTTY